MEINKDFNPAASLQAEWGNKARLWWWWWAGPCRLSPGPLGPLLHTRDTRFELIHLLNNRAAFSCLDWLWWDPVCFFNDYLCPTLQHSFRFPRDYFTLSVLLWCLSALLLIANQLLVAAKENASSSCSERKICRHLVFIFVLFSEIMTVFSRDLRSDIDIVTTGVSLL